MKCPHTHSRTLAFDRDRADQNRYTVPLVLSSETPVQRQGYNEVLDHGPDAVDLGGGPLPLLVGHETAPVPVATVDSLHVGGDRKLRGVARFGSSARALEVFEDIKAGVIRSASVGYRILDYVTDNNTLRVTRWQPFEVSAVGVGADPAAGFFRSHSTHFEGTQAMNNENEGQPAADADNEHLSRSMRRAQHSNDEANVAVQTERHRVLEIEAMGKIFAEHGVKPLAQRAVRDGTPLEDFRSVVMEHLGKRPTPSAYIGPIDTFDGRRYSVTRALRSMVDPRGTDAGYEREVSQEIAHRSGRKPRGMYFPLGQVGQRTLSVGGASDLVGTDHLGSSFIDALRARSVIMNLGPTLLPGLSADVSIPRLATSATSYWVAGDGSDGITESTPVFDAVTLSPKTLGALVKLSRKMILQSDPDAETLVRNDLAQVIASAIDKAAIQGSGASNEPTGIVNVTGVSSDTFAGAAPTFAEVVAMESALLSDNVDASAAAYLTTPALAGSLKTTEQASGSNGAMIWQAGQEPGFGVVNGLRAASTKHVPTGKVILGNWSDFIIGMWGGVDLEVNPYEDFAKGVVGVRCFASVDFGVRHAPSFAVYATP